MAVAVQRRRRVPVRELARHAARLLDEVQDGATIEVTRGGRLAAILTPVDPEDRDLWAAIDSGTVDPAVLDDSRGTELDRVLGDLAAARRIDPAGSATRALLAQRDEDDR